MARIRTVKPALFRHYDLYKAEKETKLPLRLAWIGLFTVADREGRFKWRPEEIKPDVLPFDDKVDFGDVLDALGLHGFVEKYEIDGESYGHIPKWRLHQIINNKEAHSLIPPPTSPRVRHAYPEILSNSEGEGKGKGREEEEEKEGKGTDISSEQSRDLLEALPEFSSISELLKLRRVSTKVQASWLAAFPDAHWVIGEIMKAVAWEEANPKRRKVNFGAFLTNWFSRGWDRRRHDPLAGKSLKEQMEKKYDLG